MAVVYLSNTVKPNRLGSWDLAHHIRARRDLCRGDAQLDLHQTLVSQTRRDHLVIVDSININPDKQEVGFLPPPEGPEPG